jgi:acyl dehydratase
MEGITYSRFNLGDRFVTARRTITEFDIMQYVTFSGFNEPLFLDREFIRDKSLAGKPIAPGGLTFALVEGLAVQTGIIHGTGRAFVGINRMILSLPVFIGDTIQAEIEVIEKKDRPALGGGIVTFRHDVRNAVGNRVMIYEILRLIADDRHADTLGAF